MQYTDLHDLIRNSSSARQYFLSLPSELQMQLHEHNRFIHSAAQLHMRADLIGKHNRAVAISDSLPRFMRKE